MFLFLFLSSKAKAFQCYWNNAVCHKESSMGPELDKPTESKSSEILFRLSHLWKVLYQSCTLALPGDLYKKNWDLSCYSKCSGINRTLYSRDLNSLVSQQFSLKKTAFHKIM